jgi:AmmeMemoRadiSam system protein B
MFYPSSPSKLKDQITQFLDETKSMEEFSPLAGIVVPHAGYQYSGRTAAYAYNTIKKACHTVIILSPSHREYFPGISIYGGDAYKTPLGSAPINKLIRERIIFNSRNIFEGTDGHRNEHAVEVQIPFLQVVLHDFTIVPIVIGDQRRSFLDELAYKLSDVMDENTIMVASSDLSHFFPREAADKLDKRIEDRINNFDYDGLMKELESSQCEACGGGAIVSMMKAADLRQIKKSKVLARTNSGDMTGDYSEVVGYLSAVVYG